MEVKIPFYNILNMFLTGLVFIGGCVVIFPEYALNVLSHEIIKNLENDDCEDNIRKFSGNTYYQVQRNSRNYIYTQRNQQALHQAGNASGCDKHLHNKVHSYYQSISNQITFGCFTHIFKYILHGRHLHFLLNILAEQTGRFYQQNYNQHCKYNCICHLGRNICFT